MPYRKRTRLWNNCLHFLPKICRNDCDAMDETRRRHKQVAQQGVGRHSDQRHHVRELYVVPRALVDEILLAVTKDLID